MPTLFKTVIVDDHEIARQKVKKHLLDYEFIEVIGEAKNGVEAVELIINKGPNLIFLDIQMPLMNGFEVLEYLKEKELDPHVIFATAYDEFAIKAFDVHAVDYLLKPFEKDRFSKAIEKLLKTSQTASSDIIKYYREKNPELKRILVKSGNKFKLIPVDQIDLILIEDGFSTIYCEDNSYITEYSLDSLEKTLSVEEFYRIHRSYICRLENIKQINTDGKGHYSLIYDHEVYKELPVARRKYGQLKSIVSS